MSVVVLAIILMAFVTAPEGVEFALIAQVVVVGILALVAGLYIWSATRKLTRQQSEYLWRMVRRDKRVGLGLVLLAGLGLAVAIPRAFDLETVVSRPWGTVWLVIAIDLFAVGLLDDALLVYRDRHLTRG